MSILAASLDMRSLPTAKAEKLTPREDSPPSESLVGQPLLVPLAPIVFVRGSEPTLRATFCDKYQPVNLLRPINGVEESVRIIFSDISRPTSDLMIETIHWSTAPSLPREVHSRGSSASIKCAHLGTIESNQTVGYSCSGLEMARSTEALRTLQYGKHLLHELGAANTPPHPALGQRNHPAQSP